MSSPSLETRIDATLYRDPVAAAVLNEALALLGDGVPAASIEAAAASIAMPIGPLAALDAMSLEVVDHALHAELHEIEHGHVHGHDHQHDHQHDHAPDHDHDHVHVHGPECGHDHAHHHPHAHSDSEPKPDGGLPGATHVHPVKSQRMPESAVYVLEKMAHGYKRVGRAAGAGFYDYSAQPPVLWSGLKTFERRKGNLPEADIRDRFVHAALVPSLAMAPADGGALAAALVGPRVPTTRAQALAALAAGGEAAMIARSGELAERFGPRFALLAGTAGAGGHDHD